MSRRHTPRAITPADDTAVAVIASPAGPCPGPCNHSWRTAEAKATTEREAAEKADRAPDAAIVNHGKVPRPGSPIWCADEYAVDEHGKPTDALTHTGCTTTILRDLRDLPGLAEDLTPGQLNTPRDVNSGIRSDVLAAASPSPSWDTLDDLIRWALKLEDDLRDRLGHDRARGPIEPVYVTWSTWHPPLARPTRWAIRTGQTIEKPRTLHAAIRYLSAYGGQLLTDLDTGEASGRTIRRRYRELQRGTGTTTLVHRLPLACLRCDRKGLRREDGKELVKCHWCKACWDWDHYQLLARAHAEEYAKKRRRA